MSGKFENEKKRKGLPGVAWAALAAVLLLAILAVCLLGDKPGPGGETLPGESQAAETTQPGVQASLPLDLGLGLIITEAGEYTGAYVEDGSDEVLTGVQMAVLENTSKEALQYARITLVYGQETREFSVTNLPAGEKVLLQDLNRGAWIEGAPDSGSLADPVFLEEFPLYEDVLEISGTGRQLTVKNISDTDITGDICVYYKNNIQDLYYGGITYRTWVRDGLAAGESKSVVAGHYNPSSSALVMVTYVP